MSTFMQTIYPAVAIVDPFANEDAEKSKGKETTHSPSAIMRRGVSNDDGIITQVTYDPLKRADGDPVLYKRSVEKFRLFHRGKAATDAITRRKSIKRFGAANNAQGLERGVSMVAVDTVGFEDPLSEGANQTGEERLVARLQATVKSKGTHRTATALGGDFDAFVGNAPRSNSNQRYRASPARYRPLSQSGQQSGNGISPGRGFRRDNNSPNKAFSRNSQGNNNQGNGGHNSPMFGKRSGNNSNQCGQRSPAGASAFNQSNRSTNNRLPAR